MFARKEQRNALFFVAGDPFALRSYIMKPYHFRGLSFSERVFNYRVSRARRVVENSFGIAANKFRVLRKPTLLEPTKAEKVVLAVCILHEFLISRRGQRYIHDGSVDTERTDQVNGTTREIPNRRGIHCSKLVEGKVDRVTEKNSRCISCHDREKSVGSTEEFKCLLFNNY
ncbi:hypothetical protein PR048_010444 [Dryococelus australis]|uniref:DDE Tnp4 domain-containing protein n=1 Tax=Dryococelus australis TaxID=614101 RepID=A0ABQ9I3V7_9NEOP|nr:hypothetical protein PR048_010444 [Dryococelus australis]